MPKTRNINLELTVDSETLFEKWRESINGEGKGTEQSPFSNAQIIDTEIGKLQENKQDKLTAGENITITKDATTGETIISSTGGGGASSEYNFKFQDNLTIMYDLGRYTASTSSPKTIPAAGKTFKAVFEDIFVSELPPTTTLPSATVTSLAMKSYEVGTAVSPSYSITFNAGRYSYGPATGVTDSNYIATFNGQSISDKSGIFSEVTVGDSTNLVITAVYDHSDGAIPVTNTGKPYPAGQILATTGKDAQASSSLTGYRKIFWGYTTSETLTSDVIRLLANSKKNGQLSNEFLAEDTTAKRIIIAAPKGTRTLSKVTMPSSAEADVTDDFIKQTTTVLVAGYNGYLPIEYDVWVYAPAIMAGTYKITMN